MLKSLAETMKPIEKSMSNEIIERPKVTNRKSLVSATVRVQ
jgi:hypothetical protein